jgi:hypothetical protein
LPPAWPARPVHDGNFPAGGARIKKGSIPRNAAFAGCGPVAAYIRFQVCVLQKIFSAQPFIFIDAPFSVAEPE